MSVSLLRIWLGLTYMARNSWRGLSVPKTPFQSFVTSTQMSSHISEVRDGPLRTVATMRFELFCSLCVSRAAVGIGPLELHPLSGNIGVPVRVIVECYVDEQARRGEFLGMDLCDSLGQLVTLLHGERRDVVDIIDGHGCEADLVDDR